MSNQRSEYQVEIQHCNLEHALINNEAK